MRLLTLFSTLFFISYHSAFCQRVKVEATGVSLDKVLKELNVEISFDQTALSAYTVNLKREFSNPKEAIDFLLQDKEFICEMKGDVFVIYPKPEASQDLPIEIFKYRSVMGMVVDSQTGERLPYTLVGSSKGNFFTNQDGVFNLKLLPSESVAIHIQYLGYQVLDSVINDQVQITFPLQRTTVELKEIIVASNLTAMRMQQGLSVGEVRVNHSVAKFLPGNSDNSVYTLLHLMPSVRASGEPSEEFIVCGSGHGESKMTFDGFTIFGLRNFNDNIGPINPFLVKDIRLHKAGYNATLGEQVGAIAEITGIRGNTEKSTLKINVNNLTFNVMGSTPVGKRASLVVAYRQTFYELYDTEKLNPFKRSDSTATRTYRNFSVVPNYSFRDMNIKFSGDAAKNDNYSISLYGAHDTFNYLITNYKKLSWNETVEAHQYGASLAYNHVWNGGGITSISTNFSSFNSSEDHLSGIIALGNTKLWFSTTTNMVNEFRATLKHQITVREHNRLTFGADFLTQATQFNNSVQSLNIPVLYATHNYSNGGFSLEYGLRLDVPLSEKPSFQPRFNLGYKLTESLSLNFGGGLYKQYLQQAPLADSNGAYQLVWNVSNKTEVPILESRHIITGISYQHNALLVSLEGYSKRNIGLIALRKELGVVESFVTESKARGADLFLKYEFGKLTTFGSASLCELKIQAQSLQQEYKGGVLLNVSPFFLSCNYVWGTGFTYLGSATYGDAAVKGNQEAQIYSRLDGAITYRLHPKKFNLQFGLSVLNILGRENLKYRYQAPLSKTLSGSIESVYSSAVPFTPTLFMELSF